MAEVILHGLVMATNDRSPPETSPSHTRLDCGRVMALVSTAPDGIRSLDPDGVATLALRHHAILQAYCDSGAVLPMRFGSVFSSTDALRLHIAPRADQMKIALEYLDTMQEYTLRLAFADHPLPVPQPARTGREFLARGRDLRDLRHGLAERRRVLADDLSNAVRLIATRVEPAGTPRPDRALDLVMLVKADAVEHLPALAARFCVQARALGLDLALTGPWPAYSYRLPEPEVCDGA